MSRSALSLRQCQILYDQLRAKYFLGAPEPLKVPPLAKDIVWEWLPDNSDSLGITNFEEREAGTKDWVVTRIRISRKDARRTIVRQTLLHELTHMRLGPDASCGSYHETAGNVVKRGSAWHRETHRLVELGALHL